MLRAMTTPPKPLLKDFTTFRVGGPCDRLVVAHTDADLIAAVEHADEQSIPVLILSGGSNVLVADEGFPGTVVVVATSGIEVDKSEGVHLSVRAGESWDGLVAMTVAHHFSGLELLSGIPGLVGAAPVQNIGAYGGEISSAIQRLRVYDRHTREVTTMDASQCGFGYRWSIFKQNLDRYIILSVDFLLEDSDLSRPIIYAELARHLGVEMGDRAPSPLVREKVLELRRGKGMVLDEQDHDTWSAGSFFTNPIIDPALAATLPEQAPRFPQADGLVKTSAAWLIDHAGYSRGFTMGRAGLSTKHVLALTNRGDGSAEEIIALARVIRQGVWEKYKITLEAEPLLVGLSLR